MILLISPATFQSIFFLNVSDAEYTTVGKFGAEFSCFPQPIYTSFSVSNLSLNYFVLSRNFNLSRFKFSRVLYLLAHLKGELLVYQSSCRPSVVHHFQRSSSLKPLGQSTPNLMWSILEKGGGK